MTLTTPRHALRYPEAADPDDVPLDMLHLATDLDNKMASFDSGTLAARPAATVAGRIYHATDVGRVFLSLAGAVWFELTSSALPTGSIIAYGSVTPPTGFTYCNGQAISRATFAALFAIFSTAFGVGNGTTTFNVPDLRGRVPVGADNGAGRVVTDPATLGGVGGQERHLLTAAESGMPDHNHQVIGTAGAAGAGTNVLMAGFTVNDFNGATLGSSAIPAAAAHETMQPYQIVAFHVKN